MDDILNTAVAYVENGDKIRTAVTKATENKGLSDTEQLELQLKVATLVLAQWG